MCDQQSLRSACTYGQSDQRLSKSFEYSMNMKLLTEHHLEFLSLKGGYTGSSESIHVEMPHCWKSHVTAHIYMLYCICIKLCCISEMCDVAFTNSTAVICQNPKVTAINSCIEVDLTGQICSDSIGTRIYSGT